HRHRARAGRSRDHPVHGAVEHVPRRQSRAEPEADAGPRARAGGGDRGDSRGAAPVRAGRLMVRINRIYTRTGDDGTTGLVRGPLRLKYDLRVEAYGTVDEANSF